VKVVDGEENTHSYAGKKHERGLQLVPEAELVRLVPPVHPGQCAEDGVDDQVRPAGQEKEKRGNRHAGGNAQRGEVVVVGRVEAVQLPDMAQDRPHGNYLQPFFRLPPRPEQAS
jgi:hypothetical protein